MKNLLAILILLPMLFSCSSDDNDVNKGKVDMVFNEPLFLYGESREVVKQKETRTFVSETDTDITYSETKNGLSYEIQYKFANGVVNGMSIILEYNDDIALSIKENLALNYKQITGIPIKFFNEQLNRYILLDRKGNNIEIKY